MAGYRVKFAFTSPLSHKVSIQGAPQAWHLPQRGTGCLCPADGSLVFLVNNHRVTAVSPEFCISARYLTTLSTIKNIQRRL